MNAQVEEATSVVDVIKLLLSPVFVIMGVIGFYYYADIQLLYRVVAFLVILLISSGIFLTTAKGKLLWLFIQESKQEFRRIVWPTKDEAVRTTILVFVMVTVVGLVLWLFDMLFFSIVQFLMSQGI